MSITIKHRTNLFNILRVSLTSECNLSCFYCFNEGYSKNTSIENNNLDTIEKILRCHHQLGGERVCITGGEPLLNSNIERCGGLIEKIYNNSYHVTTNGTVLNKNLKSFLKRVERINVTVPSFNRRKYCKITGADFLHKVQNNIDDLLNNECRVNINFILIPGVNDNHDEINNLIAYAIKRNMMISILKLYNQDSIKTTKGNYFRNLYKILNMFAKGSDIGVNSDCPPVTIYEFSGIRILVRDFFFEKSRYNYCVDCEFFNLCEEGLCQPRTNVNGNVKSCLFKNRNLNFKSDYFKEFEEFKVIYSNEYKYWTKY
jgi:GTP 3',8-cyclase